MTRFGTSDDFLLRYVLGQWGIAPDREVALIQMGGSQETLAGMVAKSVDGGLLSSPLHLRAASLGFSLLADLSAIGVDYQGAGVVTTRSFVREIPTRSGVIYGLTSRDCTGSKPIRTFP